MAQSTARQFSNFVAEDRPQRRDLGPRRAGSIVKAGAVLWPLESYLAHFDRLPGWVQGGDDSPVGPAAGRRDVRRPRRPALFVLPVTLRGNVACRTQPARAPRRPAGSAYHDPQLWPTHQYLAFYLWLRHEWKADAVVHLGRHGTHEFLPGKGNGLGPEDPPVVVLGDLPNIYPYIVDGIGEAVAAKRRTAAVIVTHATPPITNTPLYARTRRAAPQARPVRPGPPRRPVGNRSQLLASIRKSAGSLGYPDHPGAPGHDASVIEEIDDWVETIEAQRTPRGLHTFGEASRPMRSRPCSRGCLPKSWRGLSPITRRHDGWLAEVARANPLPAVKKGDALTGRGNGLAHAA